MANIDTFKLIENTKVPIHYGMRASNMQDIYEDYENSRNVFGVMLNAFKFGYAQGIKAEKSRVKKLKERKGK